MEDYEKQAREFLEYAGGEGMAATKRMAKGNWNEETYHDTVIRVYELIMKKKEAFIDDFGYYLRRAYYCQVLQEKKKQKALSDLVISADYSDDIYNGICDGTSYSDIEDRYQFYDRAFYRIVRYVFENYPPEDNEIWRMKRLNGYTYRKIMEITGLNFYKLQKTVSTIDKDIKKFNLKYE